MELLRAPLFHTPRNPFREDDALESFADGGLLIAAGRVAGCGDYASLRDAHPGVPTRDLRGGVLLPGFVDTHIHFPQLRVLGGLGWSLLEWLEHILPEEARMADDVHARRVARRFVHALSSHGTTTALVLARTLHRQRRRCLKRPRLPDCASSPDRCFRTGCFARICIRPRNARIASAAH